ncbi:MAG: ExeA family protein [Candidatus Abyssubacteria bacterium]
MYESFFGFKEKPFNITPDPKYLYLSAQHQEAIAHLLYGIRERGGFVAVTGEIGTGKTTLLRYLLNQLDERTEGAVVFNPNLSEIELLKSINEDFGIISTGQTKKELIDELNKFLLEERLRGKNMVLIIDEAQNLTPALLEQIRMLSNLETEKEKLIQIILIGQPQLKKLLARPELKQLDQRVTARYHLNPLSRRETYHYIRHRLEVAANGQVVSFEPPALREIYRFSKGIPRLINVVCDRALLGAFAAEQKDSISKRIVKQAIREVGGQRSSLWQRLSFDTTSARLFVYSFSATLAAVICWYAITTFASLQRTESPPPVSSSELIPDQPLAAVAENAPPKVADTQVVEPLLAASITSAKTEPPVSPYAVSYTEDEKKELMSLLLSKSHAESRLDAVLNLLALWGRTPALSIDDVNSLYGLAVSQGMRCTEVWTNFEGLRRLNVPCMLEMFVPQEFQPRYLVLTGVDAGSAQIVYDDRQTIEEPVQLLDEFWLRRAFIFWIDFERVGEVIKPGDSGAQVSWLQTSLKNLGLYSGQVNGVFDQATEAAVRKFQEENDLLLDGLVGPKTKLALYASLDRYPMPRLNGTSI